jgi:hypothetical protein
MQHTSHNNSTSSSSGSSRGCNAGVLLPVLHLGSFDRGLVLLARARADKMGKLKNSITCGKGNVVGFVGESMVLQWLWRHDVPAAIADCRDYDIVAGAGSRTKLEVKTMTASSLPKLHWNNLVSAHNGFQKADSYVFVRVVWNDKTNFELGGNAYFCGAFACSQFKQNATFRRQRDAADSRGPASNCWSMPIAQCCSWATLLCDIH